VCFGGAEVQLGDVDEVRVEECNVVAVLFSLDEVFGVLLFQNSVAGIGEGELALSSGLVSLEVGDRLAFGVRATRHDAAEVEEDRSGMFVGNVRRDQNLWSFDVGVDFDHE